MLPNAWVTLVHRFVMVTDGYGTGCFWTNSDIIQGFNKYTAFNYDSAPIKNQPSEACSPLDVVFWAKWNTGHLLIFLWHIKKILLNTWSNNKHSFCYTVLHLPRAYTLWQQASSKCKQPFTTQQGITSPRLEPSTLLPEPQILQKHTIYSTALVKMTLSGRFKYIRCPTKCY